MCGYVCVVCVPAEVSACTLSSLCLCSLFIHVEWWSVLSYIGELQFRAAVRTCLCLCRGACVCSHVFVSMFLHVPVCCVSPCSPRPCPAHRLSESGPYADPGGETTRPFP